MTERTSQRALPAPKENKRLTKQRLFYIVPDFSIRLLKMVIVIESTKAIPYQEHGR